MELILQEENGRLRLKQLAAGGYSWLHPMLDSDIFAVTVNGARLSAAELMFWGVKESIPTSGVRQSCFSLKGVGFDVDYFINTYENTALTEFWVVIRNQGQAPLRIERVDTISLNILARQAELLSFTGNWGSEFEPEWQRLSGGHILESRSGRSSKGNHPWFALFEQERVLSGSVAWSGNWVFRFEALGRDRYALSGGLHDWQFSKILDPGDSVQGAPVILALGEDLDSVSQQYARVGRKYWYAQNSLSASLPIEWNHWWPYEDVEINESVFIANVEKAAEMGFEVCTLDAGWFGPSDPETFWEHYRGDWHLVNRERFPSGIRKLSDHVHKLGMKFGIWCEIEGLGSEAAIAREHPEYVALRDGKSVGCVCFGNPQVQEWAYQILCKLIEEYQCDWIKVDFNLDPGGGCNRSDHGHQVGDGLYEHYRGYYSTLERVRESYPEVVLENCSSGGLRIDLGMLRRTYMTYLSDPDYPVHDLQLFWGASLMLAPNVLLHWTYSDWRNTNPPPEQRFNPHDPELTPEKWDYLARTSMLGLFGLSQKLPDLPAWLAQRMVENIQIYKTHVRRFIKEADLYHLTGQPRRSGEGERWVGFQYSLPDGSEHLIFVFRLPGGEAQHAIRLKGLRPDRVYQVQDWEGEWNSQASGRSLMDEGLVFSRLAEETSALLKIF